MYRGGSSGVNSNGSSRMGCRNSSACGSCGDRVDESSSRVDGNASTSDSGTYIYRARTRTGLRLLMWHHRRAAHLSITSSHLTHPLTGLHRVDLKSGRGCNFYQIRPASDACNFYKIRPEIELVMESTFTI